MTHLIKTMTIYSVFTQDCECANKNPGPLVLRRWMDGFSHAILTLFLGESQSVVWVGIIPVTFSLLYMYF